MQIDQVVALNWSKKRKEKNNQVSCDTQWSHVMFAVLADLISVICFSQKNETQCRTQPLPGPALNNPSPYVTLIYSALSVYCTLTNILFQEEIHHIKKAKRAISGGL